MEIFLIVDFIISLILQLLCMFLTYRGLLKNPQLLGYLKERYKTFSWPTKVLYLIFFGSFASCRIMTRLGSKWILNLIVTLTLCVFGFLAFKACPLILFIFLYFIEVEIYHSMINTLYERSKSFSRWVATKFFDSDESRTQEVVTFFLGNRASGPANKGTLCSLVLFALYQARGREEQKLDKATSASYKESGIVPNTIDEYISSKTMLRKLEKSNGHYPITNTEDALKEWADYLYEFAKEIFKKGTDN